MAVVDGCELGNRPLEIALHGRLLLDFDYSAGLAALAEPISEWGLPCLIAAGEIDALAVLPSRIPRSNEVGIPGVGAVAVLAADLDGVADLAVEVSVAVGVTLEVAVGALHPVFVVDVLKLDGAAPFVRGVIGDHMAVPIEEAARFIAFPHVSEDPSMAVKVRDLDIRKARIEFRAAGQERIVGPQSLDVGGFRVGHQVNRFLIRGDLLWSRGIEVFAVALVVPPDGAVIAVDDVGAGMNVADHALRGRDRVGELMADGKAGEVLWDRGVG